MSFDQDIDAAEAREIRITWGSILAAFAASVLAVGFAAGVAVGCGFLFLGGN